MKVNIVELVSSYGIKLTKVGNLYRGLCPFHEESTPSFTVYPETNSFYCFGCKKTGDWRIFLKYMDPSLLDNFKLNILSLETTLSNISRVKNYKSYVMLISSKIFYKLFGLFDKNVVYYMMRDFDEYVSKKEVITLSEANKLINLLKKQGGIK